jgi:hypothetical protein
MDNSKKREELAAWLDKMTDQLTEKWPDAFFVCAAGINDTEGQTMYSNMPPHLCAEFMRHMASGVEDKSAMVDKESN